LKARQRSLPSPGVIFGEDFLSRVEALGGRLQALGQNPEGERAQNSAGQGQEFAGHRPYRPGEDLRQLDWNLLARLDKPFVRVTRHESGESWAVLLDASASMGVGPPGKLQRAAECAVALVSFGLRSGARVSLFASGGDGQVLRRLELDAPPDVAAALELCAGLKAAGSCGLQSLLMRASTFASCSRVFLVGDLFDLKPAAVMALGRGGRQLRVLQLLAPLELDPELGPRRFWDPEGGAEVELDLDRELIEAYQRSLDGELEAWRRLASSHGVGFSCRTTRVDFEDLVLALLLG